MTTAPETRIETWHGVSPARLILAAGEIARQIAARLQDPDATAAHLLGDGGDVPNPYDMQTFSHGLAGVVMLHAELDRIDASAGWDAKADQLIRALCDNIQRHGVVAPGLFTGAAGHGFAIWGASRGETRYPKLLEQIDAGVATAAESLLALASERIGDCAVSDYDVLQGLSGIGRYLLHRTGRPRLRALLDAVLDYLIKLAEPIRHCEIAAPGWFVPAKHQMTAADMSEFPDGSFNTGVSHGISGPLALLSLAMRDGYRRPGQAEAVQRVADWLVEVSVTAAGQGRTWPAQISWRAHASGTKPGASSRNAWCYGAPGITRALYLAGSAMGDDELAAFALASFRQFFCCTSTLDLARSPTLCHGFAGILQIALRLQADSGTADFAQTSDRLAEVLVDLYDPAAPLGYKDVEERGERSFAVTKAGFLTGAAGIALTLATYGAKLAPVWDSAMLIS
jgi:lantibiotic modifying enzyme